MALKDWKKGNGDVWGNKKNILQVQNNYKGNKWVGHRVSLYDFSRLNLKKVLKEFNSPNTLKGSAISYSKALKYAKSYMRRN